MLTMNYSAPLKTYTYAWLFLLSSLFDGFRATVVAAVLFPSQVLRFYLFDADSINSF